MNSADSLTPASRTFYENTRVKMAASIFIASMGLTSLAYCSIYGGQSDSASQAANVYAGNHDDSLQKSQIALAGGFGFGAFIFFVAFAVFITAAVYISPMYCGSPNEKKMIARPQEVEHDSFAQYATNNPVHDGHEGSGHGGHGKLPTEEV